MTRSRINASLWYGIAIPEDICEQTPQVQSYGLFRKLNDGRFEFVSVCSDQYQEFFSIHKDDFERLLNEAGIKRKEGTNKEAANRLLDAALSSGKDFGR